MDSRTPDAAGVGPDADAAPGSTPQLRTLLLTDLCDSTTLVERLGDAPAATLFRAHDALVLRLQQQWRGRLIDRSDGLLLLFERPIDALGFALDYARGLREIGAERGEVLQARAGLHVGEVLTWRNSAEAVSVGAKPIEVEGLAKPMAGRLMAMARPGQILLSAVAEPLTHRAARELGPRGESLVWKAHGRWRFKGVPQAQHIFEVGEPGLAPLRAPASSPKAWRDIPLWRRPAALAAQAALLAAVATGAWFAFRPQPAIAFGERDWVVVGDLRNLTGQPVLDESLEQAFRISLEQSRYVNVLSDLKARDTLARMRRPADTKLDRAIASEIALRDGARAVILPTVSEVGGRVRISAEVVDPRTQDTVYTETADGRGLGSALSSIDTLTAALRGELGEAVRQISTDSVPLPMATTDNLEALRAYALGQRAYAASQYADAAAYYAQATELDPQFALAWAGRGRARFAHTLDPQQALPLFRHAAGLSRRLAPRERLYIDGWLAEFQEPWAVYAHWRRMALLFPDFYPASSNAAIASLTLNRFDDGLRFALRAETTKFEIVSRAHDLVGKMYVGLGDFDKAIAAFDRAIAAGATRSLRSKTAAVAAKGDLQAASGLLEQATDEDVDTSFVAMSVALERRRYEDMEAIYVDARPRAPHDRYRRGLDLNAAVGRLARGDTEGARELAAATARASLHEIKTATPSDAVDEAVNAVTAALIGLRAGTRAMSDDVEAAAQGPAWPRQSEVVADLTRVLRAERLCQAGECVAAQRELAPALHGHARFQALAAASRIYAASGDVARAREYARRLTRSRGVAYIEEGGYQAAQALNVWDAALAAGRGQAGQRR